MYIFRIHCTLIASLVTLHFIDLPDIWSVDWRQFEISFFRLCNVLDDNDDSSLASLTFGKYIFLGM